MTGARVVGLRLLAAHQDIQQYARMAIIGIGVAAAITEGPETGVIRRTVLSIN